MLTSRRRAVTQKAHEAAERILKANVECRKHCDILRQLPAELAHLPRLQHTIETIKIDLEQTMKLCHAIELSYTEVRHVSHFRHATC